MVTPPNCTHTEKLHLRLEMNQTYSAWKTTSQIPNLSHSPHTPPIRIIFQDPMRNMWLWHCTIPHSRCSFLWTNVQGCPWGRCHDNSNLHAIIYKVKAFLKLFLLWSLMQFALSNWQTQYMRTKQVIKQQSSWYNTKVYEGEKLFFANKTRGK